MEEKFKITSRQASLVNSFAHLVKVSEEEAVYWLQECGWNLKITIQKFKEAKEAVDLQRGSSPDLEQDIEASSSPERNAPYNKGVGSSDAEHPSISSPERNASYNKDVGSSDADFPSTSSPERNASYNKDVGSSDVDLPSTSSSPDRNASYNKDVESSDADHPWISSPERNASFNKDVGSSDVDFPSTSSSPERNASYDKDVGSSDTDYPWLSYSPERNVPYDKDVGASHADHPSTSYSPERNVPYDKDVGASHADHPSTSSLADHNVPYHKDVGADHWKEKVYAGHANRPSTSRSKYNPGRPHIVTLATLRQREEEENRDEDGNESASFAGGSLTSGQQILDPNKKVKAGKRKKAEEEDGKDLMQDLFKSALADGTQLGDSGSSSVVAFRRNASEPLHPSTSRGLPANVFGPSMRQEVRVTSWANGFTVDNGPLKDYNMPENKAFLKTLAEGTMPIDIYRRYPQGDVFLILDDHRFEECNPPVKGLLPFSGTGHRLGSPTPKVIEDPKPKERISAEEHFKLDEKKPFTSIQVRLLDGSRLPIRLNLNYTICDIKKYITIARPEYLACSFSLYGCLPLGRIDDHLTVEEANVHDTMLIQVLDGKCTKMEVKVKDY